MLASDVCTGELELVAEEVTQQQAWLDLALKPATVDDAADVHVLGFVQPQLPLSCSIQGRITPLRLKMYTCHRQQTRIHIKSLPSCSLAPDVEGI
jgi:hypothetical protein